MLQRFKVKFGSTEEVVKKELMKIAEVNGWDPAHVHYVLDINSSTVTDTVYATANVNTELPSHPSGPDAIMKLTG